MSRQIAEAILIHLSKDELLNSKNEYNSNGLARVKVEEDVYERKKRERKEEEDSWKEKKAWNDFKWSRGAGKRKQEQVLPDRLKKRDGKRARLDLEDEPEVVEAKRKGGALGYMAELSSPNKSMKNFKSKLDYWETITKSESSDLAGPCDESMAAKDGHKGSGGSGGWCRGYMN